MEETFQPDAIIIGTGLAGLTAAMEITNAGKKYFYWIRKLSKISVDRLSGPSVDSSLSILLNNEEWESRILMSWLYRTGKEQQV
jgi:hypothetical protein